jgi:hypothetical protein
MFAFAENESSVEWFHVLPHRQVDLAQRARYIELNRFLNNQLECIHVKRYTKE